MGYFARIQTQRNSTHKQSPRCYKPSDLLLQRYFVSYNWIVVFVLYRKGEFSTEYRKARAKEDIVDFLLM